MQTPQHQASAVPPCESFVLPSGEAVLTTMHVGDHAEVRAFWETAEGVGLTGADGEEGIRRFLRRNPGLSLVARQEGRVVGTVLCGHDGRRGWLYHLAIDRGLRRVGLATRMVKRCLDSLRAEEIERCNLMVYRTNEDAQHFYLATGWRRREELLQMSIDL